MFTILLVKTTERLNIIKSITCLDCSIPPGAHRKQISENSNKMLPNQSLQVIFYSLKGD